MKNVQIGKQQQQQHKQTNNKAKTNLLDLLQILFKNLQTNKKHMNGNVNEVTIYPTGVPLKCHFFTGGENTSLIVFSTKLPAVKCSN